MSPFEGREGEYLSALAARYDQVRRVNLYRHNCMILILHIKTRILMALAIRCSGFHSIILHLLIEDQWLHLFLLRYTPHGVRIIVVEILTLIQVTLTILSRPEYLLAFHPL